MVQPNKTLRISATSMAKLGQRQIQALERRGVQVQLKTAPTLGAPTITAPTTPRQAVTIARQVAPTVTPTPARPTPPTAPTAPTVRRIVEPRPPAIIQPPPPPPPQPKPIIPPPPEPKPVETREILPVTPTPVAPITPTLQRAVERRPAIETGKIYILTR